MARIQYLVHCSTEGHARCAYEYTFKIYPIDEEDELLKTQKKDTLIGSEDIDDSDNESLAEEEEGKYNMKDYFPEDKSEILHTNLARIFQRVLDVSDQTLDPEYKTNIIEDYDEHIYDFSKRQHIEDFLENWYLEHPRQNTPKNPPLLIREEKDICRKILISHERDYTVKGPQLSFSMNFYKREKYLSAKILWVVFYRHGWSCNSGGGSGYVSNIYMDYDKAMNEFKKVGHYVTVQTYNAKIEKEDGFIWECRLAKYLFDENKKCFVIEYQQWY
jgi:hypothetical protein